MGLSLVPGPCTQPLRGGHVLLSRTDSGLSTMRTASTVGSIAAASSGAVTGLAVLTALAMALSVFAVWLSLQTRREVRDKATDVAAEAVAITIEHGGDPRLDVEASDD